MANLDMYRGDKRTWTITVTQAGDKFDLTGSTIWFTAKKKYADADSAAIIARSTTNGGIVLTDPTKGVAEVTTLTTETSGLTGNNRTILVYDVQLKDANGRITTVAYGDLIVKPDVTTAES